MLSRRKKSGVAVESLSPSLRGHEETIQSDRLSSLQWKSDDELVVGTTPFHLAVDPNTWTPSLRPDCFLLLKTGRMIESFISHVPDRVENIVDLGIFKGGSVALWSELFDPQRIVGIELASRRAKVLDRFVSLHSLENVVKLYYGTDQGDRSALLQIMRQEFGDQLLDLVVDDGSHLYAPTKASLNVLLPCLRPGGVYVIEDWGWAHWPGEQYQGPASPYASEHTPLSKLVLELVMVAASRPGLISEMTIRNCQVFLTKGDEKVPAEGFDISRSFISTGGSLLR